MGSNLSGLVRNGQFNGRHHTVIPASKEVLKEIARIQEIKTLSVGVIQTHASRAPGLRFVEIPAGFRMVVKGNGTAQTFYLYLDSDQRETVRQRIQQAWDKLHS